MDSRIPPAFLSLVILQAVHSAEEFIFRFYESFPPMRAVYPERVPSRVVAEQPIQRDPR